MQLVSRLKPGMRPGKGWSRHGLRVRAKQCGLVLIMVLIVMVAMMFAGIAMLRSVDTTTLVAGNIAFRQAATHQADFGVEDAVSWLQTNNCTTCTTLLTNNSARGYFAIPAGPTIGTTPSTDQTWDNYWHVSLDPNPVARPVATAVTSGNVYTMATTTTGYTVSYVIHRMCPNPSSVSGCLSSPTATAATDNSKKAGDSANYAGATQIYYRITTRIEGPRNTVSYVQAVVAM